MPQFSIPFRLHRRLPLIRRPFFQRDRALMERDDARLELANALRERDDARLELGNALRSLDAARELSEQRDIREAAPSSRLPPLQFGRSTTEIVSGDDTLIQRTMSAYELAAKTELGDRDSMWFKELLDLKRDVHEALMANCVAGAQKLLRNPVSTDLYYGFENLARSIPTTDPKWEGLAPLAYRDLLHLTEVVGARRLYYPEAERSADQLPAVETILSVLDAALGFRIDFPTPFPGEVGLITERGIASYRAIHAIYQAWRIATLVHNGKEAKVLEIGGGSGRTAYYASQLGIENYTIVDLPLSGVAQANFLGRVMGEDRICLYGEQGAGIRLVPPEDFLKNRSRFDLVVNVDSLTEMSKLTAQHYCTEIFARSRRFLSINHETNTFTAREICRAAGMRQLMRAPYWMRPGQVEELFEMETSRAFAASAGGSG